MHNLLKKIIKSKDPIQGYFEKENKNYYKDKTQIGEFHVWLEENRPVEYISTISSKRSEYFK